MKYSLCERCAPWYGLAASAEEKNCYLCEGRFAPLSELIDKAIAIAKDYEFEFFGISSTIPKEILVREEAIVDQIGIMKANSVKNMLNGEIARYIGQKTKKTFSQKKSEALFSIDFLHGRASFIAVPLLIFGRYLKYSREMPQSRWGCSNCEGRGCEKCKGKGRMYLSFEDILAEMLVRECGAKGTKLHSAGREDIDARMLGDGRPFVLELADPKKRMINLAKIESEMNARSDVGVRGLRFVDTHIVDIISNCRFDKEYSALVKIENSDISSAIPKIQALEGKTLIQHTPERVLHRRADLVRERIVKKIGVAREGDMLRITIRAEAGTYIKEFISGDSGRTKPSVADVAGPAVCKELDVVRVYDRLLEDCV